MARDATSDRRLLAPAPDPDRGARAQAELAAEETDPERQRAIVDRIHERAVGLSRLTDQLLNHALIIHRADSVVRERLDLRAVAIQVAEENDHELFGHRDDLRLDLPQEAVWIRGDALSLAEASKNLVNNAFRHGAPPVGPSGGDAPWPRMSHRLRSRPGDPRGTLG